MSRDLLGDFCRWLVDRGASNRRLHPASVALAFVDHFGLSSFPRMEEITTLLDRAGVGTAVSSNLPHSFRGFHNVTKDGGFLIQYEASEWNGAQEHTVLHETYEILRKRLHDLHPAIGIPQGKRLCREADRFAASVLMQPEMFALFAESTGLDVVALQKMYQRSYASLTLRLAEVMRHQPLMAVLYEREEDGPPHLWDEAPAPSQFITKIVARTPGFRLRTQKRPLSCLRGLLPRRGAPPAQGSVAERVVQTGRPVHMQRVSGYDLWRADDITVAVRPVFWQGRLAKVALIAVPFRDRSVLSPQLGPGSFDRLPEAHQVI